MGGDIVAKGKIASKSVNTSGIADITNSVNFGNLGRKHVALDQLHIIREYIDKRDCISVASEEGVHGLRYYSGKLQVMNADGVWADIIGSSGTGACDCSEDLKDAGVATGNEVADIFKV